MERVFALREQARSAGEPILRDESFKILLETAKKHKPKRILEIGTNVGLTGIALLLCNEESKLTGIEINEEKALIALKNYKDFGLEKRSKIFIGDAGEIIPKLTGKYDLIFLDGPKGQYYQYLNDLLGVLNVHGILFADNVLFRGYVGGNVKIPRRFHTAIHSMEKFLTAISNSEKLSSRIIDVEDGISITEKISE